MTLSICTICQDEEEPIRWYLESCKHTYSILKESLPEIVLVDGGSKDNTINIIKEYQKELPIKLLEKPYECTRDQMNFGLDHCTGDFIFTPDADMTWTTNFPDVFLTNYFDTSSYWDFLILFTGKDAYHYFYKWPLGPNIRMFRKGIRWSQHRRYHVLLEGQPAGPALCREVMIFEHSARIKDDKALMNRGERRLSHAAGMEADGPGGGPGPANRFYGAAHAPDTELLPISAYSVNIANMILPSTNI